MGYKKRNNSNYQRFQSAKGGRMAALYFDMLDSKAWGALTGNDIKVYLYMLRKYTARFERGQLVKSNKDDISCTRTEYEKQLNMTHNTFEKCIDHLIELGFVRVIEYKYPRGEVGKLIIYGFSDMWQKYGTDEFYIKNAYKRYCNREYRKIHEVKN